VAINYLQRTRQQCVPTQSLNLLEAATGRDYLILRLLLSAVLRPSELFALRVNDIGTRGLRIDEVAIPGEDLRTETKTEDSAAPVPISEETELLRRAYVTREQLGINDLLFPPNWAPRCHTKVGEHGT